MTEQEIIEGNILIALFMGAEIDIETMDFVYPLNKTPTPDASCRWTYLHYQSEWDWLMPVVEKIESLSLKNDWFDYRYFTVRNEMSYCLIQGHSINSQPGTIYQSPYGVDMGNKLESIYAAIIQFITWYNTQTVTDGK